MSNTTGCGGCVKCIIPIEIDVTDTARLKELEAELSKWLGMVRYALNGTTAPLPIERTPSQSATTADEANETYTRVSELIQSCGNRFTSATIRQLVGEAASRAAVNAALGRAEQRGLIHTTQRGMGRRPTTFEKGPAPT